MNHPERLLAEIPARVSELPALVSEVPERVRKATRPRRRVLGPKHVLTFVAVLGAIGAVVSLVRARRSASSPAPGEWRVHDESAESAHEMQVRQAGSASA